MHPASPNSPLSTVPSLFTTDQEDNSIHLFESALDVTSLSQWQTLKIAPIGFAQLFKSAAATESMKAL